MYLSLSLHIYIYIYIHIHIYVYIHILWVTGAQDYQVRVSYDNDDKRY